MTPTDNLPDPDPPPLVSVMVPVFNAAPFLAETLDSVLSQTFTDFEVVAINDGSTDGSLAILQEYAKRDARIRLRTRSNLGLVATRNELLDMARGEFLAVLDADDIAMPQRLQRQVDYMRAHPECVALGTAMDVFDPTGEVLCTMFGRLTTHEEIDNGHLRTAGSAIGHSSAMMRASVVRSIGGYRDLPPAEDFDLWLRLAEKGKLAVLPTPLVRYRLSESSISHAKGMQLVVNARQAVVDAHVRRGLPPPEYPNPPRPAIREHLWTRFALAGGNYSAARRLAAKALRKYPAKADSWRLLLAVLLGRQGDSLRRLLGKLGVKRYQGM